MSVAQEIEDKLAVTLAAGFSGVSESEEEFEEIEESEVVHYEFDAAFQLKIAALTIRDYAFARKVQGLIDPGHFENAAVATLVSLATDHWFKYKETPSKTAFVQLVKNARADGKIRKDLWDEIKGALKEITFVKLTDRDFVADQVADFVRHQEIMKALEKAVDLASKKQFDKAAEIVSAASKIGVNRADIAYDYFERVADRSAERKDKVAGVKPPQGITTGIRKIDKLLYNGGWGRGELSMLMGAAKAGKSTGLLFFARNAAMAGDNVLYVTMEMSDKIASDRIDASISGVKMKELLDNIGLVEQEVSKAGKGAGHFKISQLPGYSLTPAELRRIVDSFISDGIRFDMIVLDYIDLMAPDFRTGVTTEDSKQIYVKVRAIAQEENIAMLSATQSNREGMKAIVAKMEHTSDDINKVRIADITISINSTDDERDRGEARLHFAAARNDASNITVHVKNDIERMIFIDSVIDIL
jgi:replicative DNA helicase